MGLLVLVRGVSGPGEAVGLFEETQWRADTYYQLHQGFYSMNRLHIRASKHGVQAWEFIFRRQKHEPSFTQFRVQLLVHC